MKKYITVLLVSLALAVLSGCGESEAISPQPQPEEARWSTDGFAAPGKLEEEQTFWAEQYLPWEHEEQLDAGVYGKLFWHLGLTPDSNGEAVLEIYDTASGEVSVTQISSEDLGLEAGQGHLMGMEMLDESHYVFRWVDFVQEETGLYRQSEDRMIYTDLAGNTQAVDFREIYLEKGIDREELTEVPTLRSINWHCDGKGNVYVLCRGENGDFDLYLFDREGKLLLEHAGDQGQQALEPLRAADGEMILPVYNDTDKCYEFLWVDTAEKKLLSLARLEASRPFIVQMYGMLGNELYYRSQEGTEEGIVRWEIGSGRRVQVLGFQTAGIDTGYRTMLALGEEQTPVLRLTKFKEGRPREWVAPLVEQKPKTQGAIRVANLTESEEAGGKVAECAVLASMETPGIRYEYEDASAQEARDRIMAELFQGKGPDLLFVSLEDMRVLEEKGLLLEIEDLISPELREELLPAVLEIGASGGRLVGVPAAVRAETLVAAENTWNRDTWSLEDIIGLMEEGKLAGAIRSYPLMQGRYLPPLSTVMELVNYSLADSFLIDWENRKSHFDDERFIRLLEFTGTDMSGAAVNTEAWIDEGKNILWGYFTSESAFLDFFAYMEAEGGRILGFPTEGSSGSYLSAEGGVLVVNANLDRKEAAACFLETLLGEELQSKKSGMCLSVRKLSPEDYIVEQESGRLVFMGGNSAPEVPVFSDGSTSLHRASDFLENCVATPPGYSQINKIVREELSAMYAEGIPPEKAAQNINSRVQIYLDEGN